MAEVFWNSWFDANSRNSLDYLFDAILLKKETPFPDHIIVPEFEENEKIVLTTYLPNLFPTKQNELLIYLFSKVLDLIPNKSQVTILLHCSNQDLIDSWKKHFSFIKTIVEEAFIEIPFPKSEISPFSSKAPPKRYVNHPFLPISIDQANQIIPIVPFFPSSLFKVSGVISSFFWFLPTKIKNEILIQNTIEQRTAAFMEVVFLFFNKITLSGTLYQGDTSFSVFGNDPVSVDAFSSALMSVKASSVPTTKYSRKNKIGMGDLLKIHVQGERFKKPVAKDRENFKEKYLLFIDPEKCNLCEICLHLCPLHAFIKQDKRLLYEKKQCNCCGLCVSVCPLKAISEI